MRTENSPDGTESTVKKPDTAEWAAFLTAKSRMAEALTQLNVLLKHANKDTSCNHKIQPTELRAL